MIMDTSIIRTLPSVPIVDSEIYTVRTHTGDTGDTGDTPFGAVAIIV